MNDTLAVAMEMLKFIIPALIVFVTVYFTIKRFLDQQYGMEALKFKQEQLKQTMTLKLQAYERLMLFCERVNIENLLFRLNTKNMRSGDLQRAMMIAVQQEFEHNLTQQVYVSDKLWQIINLAKSQIQDVIMQAGNAVLDDSPGTAIAEKAMSLMKELNIDPLAHAKRAIKKELEILF